MPPIALRLHARRLVRDRFTPHAAASSPSRDVSSLCIRPNTALLDDQPLYFSQKNKLKIETLALYTRNQSLLLAL